MQARKQQLELDAHILTTPKTSSHSAATSSLPSPHNLAPRGWSVDWHHQRRIGAHLTFCSHAHPRPTKSESLCVCGGGGAGGGGVPRSVL